MFDLAVIPAIVLMIFIYKKDRREKEPFKLLMKCFWFGVLSIIPAVLFEYLGEYLFESDIQVGSYYYAVVDAFIVTAFSEELFKFVALKMKTWKSPDFNCKYDGIVYAVFVGMGFALFENVMYLIDGTLSDALLRMLVAVPGHACYAVFMGFFYSRAKQASLYGNKRMVRRNNFLALFVPIILHGIYDCLISVEEEVIGEDPMTVCVLLWITFVLAMFIFSFVLINRTSKGDMPFSMQRVTWECSCGNINNGKFCTKCGAAKISMQMR